MSYAWKVIVLLAAVTITAECAVIDVRHLNKKNGLANAVLEVSDSLRNVYPAADFNRNVSTTWWQTQVLDGASARQSDDLSQQLSQASFIVLDKDMYSLLDIANSTSTQTVDKIFDFPAGPSWASRLVHDGTVYSPECNCIFFAELRPPKNGFSTQAMPWVWQINLNSSTPVVEKVYPQPQLTIANGAYYHNGSVYWAQEGNYTVPGGILKMNPLTLETSVELNNFFGHRFNSPNDVIVTRDDILYFTDGYYGHDNFNDSLKSELTNGVWRWNMKTADLRQVAGAAGGPFTNPNGLALSLQEDALFVTNRGNTSDNPAGGRTIYSFDLHDSGLPVTGGDVFTYVDSGFPDGIKTDVDGRVYAAVNGGVNVYDRCGTQLGIIRVSAGDTAVNLQWVKDWMYIVGRDSVYRVHLNSRGVQDI